MATSRSEQPRWCIVSGGSHTVVSNRQESRKRARIAGAYVEVAGLVLEEPEREEFLTVSAGLSVLAGIAASDAICAARLHQIHKGDDHRGATDLLRTATPDGKKLSATLARLLDVKDAAHYGVVFVSTTKAREALKWAKLLAERAKKEVEK